MPATTVPTAPMPVQPATEAPQPQPLAETAAEPPLEEPPAVPDLPEPSDVALPAEPAAAPMVAEPAAQTGAAPFEPVQPAETPVQRRHAPATVQNRSTARRVTPADMNPESLRRAVLMAEILGKPVGLR